MRLILGDPRVATGLGFRAWGVIAHFWVWGLRFRVLGLGFGFGDNTSYTQVLKPGGTWS